MLIDFNIPGVSVFVTSLPFDFQLESSHTHLLPSEMLEGSRIRKQEFIAGRYCAIQAAQNLGLNLTLLPRSPSREPLWPIGFIGSISHSKKLAISCVSQFGDISSIGIDAEEIMKPSVSQEIEKAIATEDELALLPVSEYQVGITTLFSAKEALYKSLFPLVKTFFDFKDVKLTKFVADKQVFELELISCDRQLAGHIGRYEGSFKRLGETIITMVSIPNKLRQRDHVHS